MQCGVTVVNLIHDTAPRSTGLSATSSPVQLAGLLADTSGGGPSGQIHVRLPPAAGIGLFFQAAPARGKRHTGRSSGAAKLICGAVRSLTRPSMPPSENIHLLHGGGGLRQPGTAAAAFSCRG